MLLVATVGRCRVPTGGMGGRRPVPIVRFTGAPGSYAYYSGIDDSLHVAIRDRAQWQRYWTAIHRRISPQPPLPDVDFAREIVLLAAMGRRPSGGYVLRIASASEMAGVLRVDVERREPGRGCILNAALTSPVDLVRVVSRADSVVFVEHRRVEDCR